MIYWSTDPIERPARKTCGTAARWGPRNILVVDVVLQHAADYNNDHPSCKWEHTVHADHMRKPLANEYGIIL